MKNDFRAFRELLLNRNFTLYILTYHITALGSSMTMFATWSQVTLLTGNNPGALGLATVLNALPGILVAPWSGSLTDRVSKRTLLILCYVVRAVMVGLMFLSTDLWQLYLLSALQSMVGSFSEPPHRAFLPLLVKQEQYVSMNAFMATLNNFMQLFRPALAGLVISVFGYKTGFAIDFCTYFVPAAALLFIRVPDQAAQRSKQDLQENGMWREMRDGLAYIRTQPILIYLFLYLTFFTLAIGLQGPLTMVFVGQHLTTNANEASKITGLLFSATGIGGVIGAFLTPRLLKKMSMLRLLLTSLLFDGCFVCIFSLSRTFALALCCFALFGLLNSITSIAQDTIIQTIVPENLRGRVYGALGPITGPINLISMGAGTSLANVIGTRAVFFIAGLIEIATVAILRVLPLYGGVRRSLAEAIPTMSSEALATSPAQQEAN